MQRDLESLRDDAEKAAREMLAELDAKGVTYYVNETFRTDETQRAYYAQGRRVLPEVNELRRKAGLAPIGDRENQNTVTDSDGEKSVSRHQRRIALDIYPTAGGRRLLTVTADNVQAWLAIAEAGERAGFEWGGRWAPLGSLGIGWDPPHFAYTGIRKVTPAPARKAEAAPETPKEKPAAPAPVILPHKGKAAL